MAQLTIQQAFERAVKHFEAGELPQAEQFCRQILAFQPAHSGAVYYSGLVALQRKQNTVAIDRLRRAIILNPGFGQAYNNLGIALANAGQPNPAIAAFRQACALMPASVESHFNLGSALLRNGRAEEAAAALRRTIDLKNDFAEVHNALGTALFVLRKPDESIASHQQAIQLKPDYAEAYIGLSAALGSKDQAEDALAACARAVELAPDVGEFHTELGNILARLGRLTEAAAACRRGVELTPNLAAAHIALSHALSKAGDREQAIISLREAYRLDLGSQHLALELAALSGDGSMPTTPSAVVREEFDHYSQGFEKHLVDDLHYRVPEHIRKAVQSLTSRTDLDILDLGCGTGLCGVELRPMARRLEGVDLSPAMLSQCAEKGIYDRLVEGDLTDILCRTPAQWDLIVAGDVMIYVGDLSAVIPAASAALKPRGWIAFSLERYDGTGFSLQMSLRYSHSLVYVQRIAAQANLKQVLITEIAVRLEVGVPVPGWIVVLGKP
jgi:predicted TPR repeat methyltransferase